MMLSRSITWLLFLSLPLMALARRFPNYGATEKVASRQVWLKKVVFVREVSLSEGIIISLVNSSNGNREEVTRIVNGVDVRRKLEGIPRFVGPGVGSRPPTCTGRCGTCSPCLPVNVPVGAKTNDEYYPEVWRCQCDDRLYIP